MIATQAKFVSQLVTRAVGLAIAYSLSTSVAPARADDPPPVKTDAKSDSVDEAAYATPMLHFVYVDKPYVVDANELGPVRTRTDVQEKDVPRLNPLDEPRFAAVLHLVAPLFQEESIGYVEPRSGIRQSELNDMLKYASGKRVGDDWITEFFRQLGAREPGEASQEKSRPRFMGYLRFDQQRTDMRSSVPPSLPWKQAVPDFTGAQDYISGQRFFRAKEEVYLLATTKERAEELAKAFVSLVSQGKALPGRVQSLAWKKAADAELKEAQKKLAAAQGELDKQDKALKALADAPVVSYDTLKELKTKKVLLSVDRAGVAARVAAAEKLIKTVLDSPAGPERQLSVIAVKESAEIELAGLTGQTAEIDRLIDNSAKRIAVERDRTNANTYRDNALVAVQKAQAIVAAQEANIKATAPVELLDEAIAIRPVQLKASEGK